MADKDINGDLEPISSPCIRNCCLNEEDICLGCFRHVDEIIEWGSTDNKRRQHILTNSVKRREKHQAKYER